MIFEAISSQGNWKNGAAPPLTTPFSTLWSIFEPNLRWNDPVIQETVLFTMEIFTEPENKWRQIGKWVLPLLERQWSDLTENGASFRAIMIDPLVIQKDKMIYPADLHKYTGTKNPIPKGGYNAKPSYLAYPSEKSIDSQTPPDVS